MSIASKALAAAEKAKAKIRSATRKKARAQSPSAVERLSALAQLKRDRAERLGVTLPLASRHDRRAAKPKGARLRDPKLRLQAPPPRGKY